MSYTAISSLLKAISSLIRLEILDLLSCGELCACDLLDYFQITQPTLSHHMKSLINSNLINIRKEGTKRFYSLNDIHYKEFLEQLRCIGTKTSPCICNHLNKGEY